MAKNQNGEALHKTNLDWYVWLENKINHLRMMGKSVFYIVAISFAAMVVAAFITTTLGLYHPHLDVAFYFKFVLLSLSSILNSDKRELWWKAFDAIGSDLGSMVMWHLIVGVGVGYFLFKKVSQNTEEMAKTKYIDGSKFVSEKEQIAKIKKKIEKKEMSSRFPLGQIPFPVDAETYHVCISASTGNGKGVTLSSIIPQIGKYKNVRGLVHDTAPEWVQTSYRPDRGDLIFNPLDKRSLKWTIFNDLHSIQDIKQFVMWVIPFNPELKDQIWDTGARSILEGVLTYLWKIDDCSNDSIRRTVRMPHNELKEKLQGLEAVKFLDKSDMVLTLAAKLGWLDFIPDGKFSIGDWMVNGRGLIFLLNPEETNALFAPVLSLFVNAFCSHILRLEPNYDRRIYLFLDEFTSLQKLPMVIRLLDLGRKYGASIWLAFQSFQKLQEIYSQNEMKVIINACNSIAVGRINDPEGCKFFSDRFSTQTFMENTQTNSMGINDNKDSLSLNYARKESAIIKPTQIKNLQPLQFYVEIKGVDGVTLTHSKIQNLGKIAVGFDLLTLSKEEQVDLMYAVDTANAEKEFEDKAKKALEEEAEKMKKEENIVYADEYGY